MKLLKYLLPIAMVFAFTTAPVFAFDGSAQDGSDFSEELNEQDFDALRNFINTKRDIPLAKKENNLVISGDIRTEWRNMSETGRKGGYFGKQRTLRGGNATSYKAYPVSKNDWDIEFNLYFKYTTERTWAVAQLNFDNPAGVFGNGKECPGQGPNTFQGQYSIFYDGQLDPDPYGWHGTGRCNDVCLKKAYMGYNLLACGDERVDIELGRRRLNNVFDSNIQFCSQFDGILLKYSSKFENVADWYINIAGLTVNERIDQFAWVAETGFMNIADSGVDFKLSFIDWKRRGRTQCYINDDAGKRIYFDNPEAFDYQNLQATFYYNLDPDYCYGMPVTFNGAFLVNLARNKATYLKSFNLKPGNKPVWERLDTGHTWGNVGWYIGFEIGEVFKEGDWSFEAQYQYVGPAAVSDGDVRGIGRGNVLSESITNVGRGNANFKGYKFELLYALTDNITIDSIIEWSKQVNRKVGGAHHFSKYKMEAIYAF